MLFLTTWFGVFIGALASGLYVVIAPIMYIIEKTKAKKENRQIRPQYAGMMRKVIVALVVGLIFVGLCYGLAYLALSGM